MGKQEILDYTQNRELSWLRFNQRVLEEARDETVPLMERMKFVAIFTSNLDEFFMIRVGSLYDMAAADNKKLDIRSGMTAGQQLGAIYAAVAPLYKERDKTYACLLYTSPSPRDATLSRMPSSACHKIIPSIAVTTHL